LVPTATINSHGPSKPDGREVAAGIPGARFVPLPGKNHMPLEQDPAAPRILEEINLFLKS